MYMYVSQAALCCKVDGQSQWKTPIFGPLQLRNPLTDFDKIFETDNYIGEIWFSGGVSPYR